MYKHTYFCDKRKIHYWNELHVVFAAEIDSSGRCLLEKIMTYLHQAFFGQKNLLNACIFAEPYP